MTEVELKQEIKKQTLSGVYFFYGEEDYMKSHYAKEMRDAMLRDPSLASFNHFVFRDENATVGAILDAVLSPAMMLPQKLVDVALTDGDLFRDKAGVTRLLEIASQSADTVLLIRMSAGSIDEGTAKKPSAIVKLFEKEAHCLRFEYRTEGQLIKWLERHAGEYGVTLGQNEALTILRRAGRGMFRLQGEIRKAAAFAAANGYSAITEDVIRAVVTKTDDEDAFRLANCILNGDQRSALLCLDEKIRRREEPTVILGQITRAFCDLAAASRFLADGRDKAEFAKAMSIHAYRAELYFRAARGISPERLDEAVSACAEADRQLKSSPLGYIAIERLICR